MFHALDLLLTYECPARCRHCAYFCGPGDGTFISLERAEDYLGLPGLRSLTVHGGEPTLHFDLLCDILQLAMKACIPETWLITNGFWGRSETETRNMLRRLRESGLENISFSLDSLHQEHIPFSSVLRCVEEASSMDFEEVCVDAYYVIGPLSDNLDDSNTASLLDRISHLDVKVNERRLAFYGRGGQLSIGVSRTYLPSGKCAPPFWIGKDLRKPDTVEVDPFGNVTLCPGLRIGNTKRRSLQDISIEYSDRGNPIVNLLMEKGPIGLVNMADDLGIDHGDQFVDECHLCYEMRRLLRPFFSENLGPRRCYGLCEDIDHAD